jgi:hypothetical protein
MIFSEDAAEQYCACWALVWLGGLRLWAPPVETDLLGRLFRLWNSSQKEDVRYEAAYALASQQLVPREETNSCASIPRLEIKVLLDRYGKTKVWMDMPATLVVAWYSRTLSDREIANHAWKLLTKSDPHTIRRTLCELLDMIGKSPEETE